MAELRILALGDVVGRAASDALCKKLWSIRKENNIDIVTVNAENSAPGNGIDADTASALLSAGADVLTTGNHVWKKYDIGNFLDDNENVLRPVNFPSETPGYGYTIIDSPSGYRVLVINVMGVVYMESLNCPFAAVEAVLDKTAGKYDAAVLDIHAEATGEKAAIARCFDGRLSAVFGTHTHVQTADARILPNGTGFITDLGMCGPDNSILGIKSEIIIKKLRTKMPARFEVADGKITLHGAVFTVNTDSGKCIEIKAFAEDC